MDLLKERTGTDSVLIITYPPVSEILTVIHMPAKVMIYVRFPEVALIWQSSWQDNTLCRTPFLEDRIGRLWLKLLGKGISPQ